jgi:hypothetical protein
MPAPKGWDTNPSGGLAVNPLVGWDLIGTTDGVNAVLRLEFATDETERKAVQLIIATPAFRPLGRPYNAPLGSQRSNNAASPWPKDAPSGAIPRCEAIA